MNLGIILNTNDAETVWNAFRIGVSALDKKQHAKMFLLGKGVEWESAQDKKFDSKKSAEAFKKRNGIMLACGTCLATRGRQNAKLCTISTIGELIELIKWADKIISL